MVRLSPRSFRVVAEHEQVKKLSSAPALADHVGCMLRESREAIGYDLSQVAHALCIRTLYLQAIEEGRYADLPGTTYAVGFVRTYADYLGLDSDAVVARFKSETAAARSGKRPLAFPEPRPDRPFPGVAVAALSAVLIAGVFAGWVYLRDAPTTVTVAIAPPPAAGPPATATVTLPSAVGGLEIPITTAAGDQTADRITLPPAPAPVATVAPATAPAAPPAAEPAAAAPPAAEPAAAAPIIPIIPIVPADAQLAAPAPVPVAPRPPAAATATVPPARTSAIAANARSLPATLEPPAADAAPVENTVAALPAVPESAITGATGREYGAANRDARIVLTALAESWVQIRDAQENVVLTRMLQPGDTFRVPNRDDLTLLTGNAGGLEITVDGAAIPPLGPSGAVRRDIALTPVHLIGG